MKFPAKSDFGQSARAGPLRIAVLVPCYNEEASIEKVIRDFRANLPDATIYVYDNNSSNNTVEIARRQGAVVRRERLQGKRNVVRRMFADIEADVYILVDGDDTYDATAAPAMVSRLIDERLDMVNALRVSETQDAYRRGHRFGNRMLTGLAATILGKRIMDMLSGYRASSRRFVKSFPALSRGFEIETELTIHAVELRMPIAEVRTAYRGRPEGSSSKLNTIRDGVRILATIMTLVRDERPLHFFSTISLLLCGLSVLLGWPLVATFLETGLVPRLPTAVLATGLGILGFMALACGLILDTVTRGRRELKRLRYLAIPLAQADPVEQAATSSVA